MGDIRPSYLLSMWIPMAVWEEEVVVVPTVEVDRTVAWEVTMEGSIVLPTTTITEETLTVNMIANEEWKNGRVENVKNSIRPSLRTRVLRHTRIYIQILRRYPQSHPISIHILGLVLKSFRILEEVAHGRQPGQRMLLLVG